MNIKLNDEERLEVVKLFKNEVPTVDIAKLFCISKTTVRDIVKKSGNRYKPQTDLRRKYKLNEECFGNFEPCKSTRERIPKFYNREDINMRHFWRGLIDADGSLFISKDQKEHLNLISSIEVINEFEAFVKFHTGISMTSVQQHTTTKDCYYANYYCRNALTVADLLYKDSSIFLQRKFEKYEELMSKEHRFIKKDLDRYVSYIKSQNVYKVYVDIPANKFRGKTKVYLGRFKNIEDARKVRDEFVILLRGLQSE